MRQKSSANNRVPAVVQANVLHEEHGDFPWKTDSFVLSENKTNQPMNAYNSAHFSSR